MSPVTMQALYPNRFEHGKAISQFETSPVFTYITLILDVTTWPKPSDGDISFSDTTASTEIGLFHKTRFSESDEEDDFESDDEEAETEDYKDVLLHPLWVSPDEV